MTSTADVGEDLGKGSTAAPAPVVDDARTVVLEAAVTRLETLSRFDRADIDQQAHEAAAEAGALGRADLAQRARLVQADLL